MKDLLVGIHFPTVFEAIWVDFVDFFSVLELRRPFQELSVPIYSKICWNMLGNIDGPAGIS